MPITKDTPVNQVIHDFVKSKDSRFDGDSKKKRIKRALAAFYNKEEIDMTDVNEGWGPHKKTDKLWRVVGTSKNGGKVTAKIRAADHAEAKEKAKKNNINPHDVVLHTEELQEDHNHSDTDVSHGARELILHGDNTAHLYHTSKVPIMKNLEKKHNKGVYDHEKAKKLWGYHADRAAQSYAREHGHPGVKWHEMFSTKDRKQAASHWADEHHHEMKSGNFHESETDHAAEIVFAAMGAEPVGVSGNFKDALVERTYGLVEEKKTELAGRFFEKWDNDYETPKSKRGMWDGDNVEDLEKMKKKASGTRLKQIDFAIRAKRHWKGDTN